MHNRKILTLEILPLILTAIIAVTACLSTYFTYKTAQIVQGQESREKRKELAQWISVMNEVLNTVKVLEEKVEEQSTEKNDGE
jgi:cell division protein FtsL|tara:strand:- start:2129 stop:2377 length:249 start_codon:yes stop_codon:yes gene_type:complete